MTNQEIIKKINKSLSDTFEIPIESITPDADIRQTLDLDSMRALELVVMARKQFGIEMTPRQMPYMVTFDDLYEFILQNQKKDE